ncbi:MAG: TIGR03435 family protein [Bryobacteraceae bacterium]
MGALRQRPHSVSRFASGRSAVARRSGTLAGRRALEERKNENPGASGVFDFRLDWAVDEEHEAAGIPSIRVALEEKLGLKLEPRKLPVEMLVIDHLEKKPSEN